MSDRPIDVEAFIADIHEHPDEKIEEVVPILRQLAAALKEARRFEKETVDASTIAIKMSNDRAEKAEEK